MRLLFVSHCPNDPNGGASRVYHLLSAGLSARGHESHCLHLETASIPRVSRSLAVRLFLPKVMSRLASRFLAADGASFDVIFSSNGMLSPLYKKIWTKTERPLLINHVHGLNHFDNQAAISEAARGHGHISAIHRYWTGPRWLRWDMEGVRYSDLSIVQNKRDEDFLREKDCARVCRIPLAVYPEILAAGMTAPRQESRNPFSLLWFGSWSERKGAHYLPRAFDRIAERFPESILTIGGTGLPQREVLGCFREPLRKRVRVIPRISVEEQIVELRNHAVFLFPSLSEGFGFAALEALAMRMALVTTSTGLGGDFLVDRQHARVIPAASALHLADAVIELIENPQIRQCVAEQGWRLANTLTVERMVNEYERVLVAALC
jgi:glycosyltransferase involved in cell wall biosynthesis